MATTSPAAKRSSCCAGHRASGPRALLALLAAALPLLAPWAPATVGAAMVDAAPARGSAVRVVDDRGRAVVLPAPARRVVSLLPSLTETVCALEACDRLAGVDRWSNWPAAVAALPRLGGLEDPAIERIVALAPDLVLAPRSSRATGRLEALGLTVVALEPTDLSGVRRTIAIVGALLGRDDAARALWERLQGQLAEAAARAPAATRGARVYVEVSEVPHAAGASSFVGELVAALGLINIVPAGLGPFPALSPEFVVRAAPEWIVVAERTLPALRARPGWAAVPALADDRVCALPPSDVDLLVRTGPRLGEAAALLVRCLAERTAAARGTTGRGTTARTALGR
jgi:iron complex transport system substrate-binding protein